MPSLRKLKLKIRFYSAHLDGPGLLARICTKFPCIEELCIDSTEVIPDVVFLGENEELPFLQLASNKEFFCCCIFLFKWFIKINHAFFEELEALDLGVVDKQHGPLSCGQRPVCFSDASFIRVFSQMMLRKFRFRSSAPLQHVRNS